MGDRQATNVVCYTRFVGKMRSILGPAGDLVDTLKGAKNNMPDASLNCGIRQLPAKRSLNCRRRSDGRRHQECAIRAFERSNEVLLKAEFERDPYDFSAELLQASSL